MGTVTDLYDDTQKVDNFINNTTRTIQKSLIERFMELLKPYTSIYPKDLDYVFCQVMDRLTAIRAEEEREFIENFKKKQED